MILDTSALSAFVDGDAGLGEILRRESRAAIPAIVQARLADFEILAVTDDTATAYAGLRVALKRSGRPIPANDTWIAALALQHRLPVLSRDQHFDAVPGLRRQGW